MCHFNYFETGLVAAIDSHTRIRPMHPESVIYNGKNIESTTAKNVKVT